MGTTGVATPRSGLVITAALGYAVLDHLGAAEGAGRLARSPPTRPGPGPGDSWAALATRSRAGAAAPPGSLSPGPRRPPPPWLCARRPWPRPRSPLPWPWPARSTTCWIMGLARLWSTRGFPGNRVEPYLAGTDYMQGHGVLPSAPAARCSRPRSSACSFVFVPVQHDLPGEAAREYLIGAEAGRPAS